MYKNFNEQHVSFETAKMLKELGFDWDTEYCYCGEYEYDAEFTTHLSVYEEVYDGYVYPAPTQEVAMKWLREKHNYFIWVTPVSKFVDYTEIAESFVLYYQRLGKSPLSRSIVHIPTYEEAVERGIQESLKVIKAWEGREV